MILNAIKLTGICLTAAICTVLSIGVVVVVIVAGTVLLTN